MEPECILLTEWPLTGPCPCKLCRKMQAGAKHFAEAHTKRLAEMFAEVLKASEKS